MSEIIEFVASIGKSTTTVKGQLQLTLLVSGLDAEQVAIAAINHPQQMVQFTVSELDFSADAEDQDALFDMLDRLGDGFDEETDG